MQNDKMTKMTKNDGFWGGLHIYIYNEKKIYIKQEWNKTPVILSFCHFVIFFFFPIHYI